MTHGRRIKRNLVDAGFSTFTNKTDKYHTKTKYKMQNYDLVQDIINKELKRQQIAAKVIQKAQERAEKRRRLSKKLSDTVLFKKLSKKSSIGKISTDQNEPEKQKRIYCLLLAPCWKSSPEINC